MKNILVAFLILTSTYSSAREMDKGGNPVLTPSPKALSTAQMEASISANNDMAGINLLKEVLAHIKISYYKDIDMSLCIPGILKSGISECTDRYSYYLDPPEAEKEEKEFMSGEMVGIGIVLELNPAQEGGAKILNVFEGSPAEKAGLLINDIIMGVSSGDNAETESMIIVEKMPLDKIIDLIRGKKGTAVNLLVIRGKDRKKISVTRDTLKIPFVKSKMLNGKVGYLQISAFGGEVADQSFDAIRKLSEAGAKALVIDLRNNGGGKLDSVIDMCSWFAKTENSTATILYVKERVGPYHDVTMTGNRVGEFRNMKVAVLQNGNSASASEIFSGYLKSEAEATVVGEKSYGKGVVQSLIPLKNNGKLHLTIAEYFIGKKLIKVHGIGVIPTVELKRTKPAKTEQDDEQLQRAIQEAEKLLKK